MSGGVTIGVQALNNNTIGSHNTALGGMALSGGAPRSAEEVLVAKVIHDLLEAVHNLKAHIEPFMLPTCQASLVRPRIFKICDDIYWPRIYCGKVDFYAATIIGANGDETYGETIPFIDDKIIRRCQTPRDVIVAIRRIQAATAWCEARVDGLERYNQQEVR